MVRTTAKLLLFMLLLALPLATLYAHGEEEPEEQTSTTVTTDDHNETPLWSVIASLGLATVISGGSWTAARHKLTALDYVIITFIATTGIIHFILGLQGDTLLLVNGIGYLGLAGLRFLPLITNPAHERLLDLTIVAYAAVTIVGYSVIHGDVDTVGLITKATEVMLILIIGFNFFQQWNYQPVQS